MFNPENIEHVNTADHGLLVKPSDYDQLLLLWKEAQTQNKFLRKLVQQSMPGRKVVKQSDQAPTPESLNAVHPQL